MSPNHSILEAKISVNQLVDLVQQIASIPEKLLKVPKTIISKLEKAIELHCQYLALYSIRTSDANNANSDLKAKNQGHAHFVHTLECVLCTLQLPSCHNQPENCPITSDPPTSERDN
ncbi:hypothetical protein CROQUDRAFT_134717 [Cronartium quercuum f. sp. fusiforme G11]|uniref:DUF6604 domain-containing protein n=1 Tax=Cronartium quercuum f. sp. fusiforme G11 TaxID=708437 RepID=A0A9P6T9S4_9BASI|nr:hypothetical protein CROQUDRAFT_134717 [Cronartium quercuum f. sp. fusiforme G11]